MMREAMTPRATTLALGTFVALAACSPASSPSSPTRRPQEEIQRTVHEGFGALEACYDDALRVTPTLSLRVTTRFTVGREGKVVDVESDAPSNPPGFADCLEQAFAGITFSKGHAEQRVTYPIDFSPAQ